MNVQQSSGIDLLKTCAACVLAPIISVVAAGLVGGIWFLLNNFMTVIRPEILNFIAAIIGGIVGMYAARFACDSWLKGYIPQAVFMIYAIVVLGSAYMYVVLLPFEWNKLASYAQVSIIAFMAYRLFWIVDPIDT